MLPELKSASTLAPSARKTSMILRASVMSGTFARLTGSRVSSVAQSTGKTAFLLAEGVMAPESGRPPSTISRAILKKVRKAAPMRASSCGMAVMRKRCYLRRRPRKSWAGPHGPRATSPERAPRLRGRGPALELYPRGRRALRHAGRGQPSGEGAGGEAGRAAVQPAAAWAGADRRRTGAAAGPERRLRPHGPRHAALRGRRGHGDPHRRRGRHLRGALAAAAFGGVPRSQPADRASAFDPQQQGGPGRGGSGHGDPLRRRRLARRRGGAGADGAGRAALHAVAGRPARLGPGARQRAAAALLPTRGVAGLVRSGRGGNAAADRLGVRLAQPDGAGGDHGRGRRARPAADVRPRAARAPAGAAVSTDR